MYVKWVAVLMKPQQIIPQTAFSVSSTDLIAPFSSLFWFTGPQLLPIVLFLAAAVKRLPC